MAKGHQEKGRRTSVSSAYGDPSRIPGETCVIQPERSRPLWRWDAVCGILLIAVAICTPFEAGFLETETLSFMGVLNIITNVFFMMDMFMQFFIAYPIETRYGPRWEYRKRLIALCYLKGWFTIDLASTLPLDFLSPGSGLGLLRTIRMLRLLKLLRLARGIRVVRRYQAEVGLSYRKFTLYLLFFAVLAVSHWLACTLGVIHKFQIEGEICSNSDMYAGRPDCSTSWMTEAFRHHANAEWDDSETPQIDVFDAYVMAFYTGITILVHPHAYDAINTAERLLFTILLLIGGFMWTQVISRSTAIASSLNAHQLAHQQTMDDLNNIADRLNLSRDMKIRLRKFFLRSTAQHEYEAWQEILNRMSPQLRRDTYREVNVHWVKKVRFFDSCSTSFLIGIAEILEIKMFGEQEHFGQLFHMYIMMGGAASRVVNFTLLLPGMVWGEDHLLLSNPDLVASNIAVSLTVVEVQELAKAGFDAVLEDFPEHVQDLRQVVVKYIFMRGLKRLAALTLQRREQLEAAARGESATESETSEGALRHLRSPTASAWDKMLEESPGTPQLRNSKTQELDAHAQSMKDGARLISMQWNKAQKGASKDGSPASPATPATSGHLPSKSEVRDAKEKVKQAKRKPIQDASQAAAVAWYSPMDAAAAATAAAVSVADHSQVGDTMIEDWINRQDELEEGVFKRLDEVSEQIYSLYEMMQEQQDLLQQQLVPQKETPEAPLEQRSLPSSEHFDLFRTTPKIPKKPDLQLRDEMPSYE